MLHCPDVCPSIVRSITVILGTYDSSSVGLLLTIHWGWIDITKVRLTSRKPVSADSQFDPGSPDLHVCDSQGNVCVEPICLAVQVSSFSHTELNNVFINFLPLAATMETLDEISPAVTFHLEHFGLNKHTSSLSVPPCSPFWMLLNLGKSCYFTFNISVIDYTNL